MMIKTDELYFFKSQKFALSSLVSLVIISPFFIENAMTQQSSLPDTISFAHNESPSFIFDYPQDWQVSENFLVTIGWIASFYDNFQDISVIDLYIYKNDESLRNSPDKEIIDFSFLSYFFLCSEATFNQTGYECFDFTPLDSKVFTVDGRKAYQTKYSWIKIFPDGRMDENINTVTDIWTGPIDGNIISIQSQINSDEYEFYSDAYHDIIESLRFVNQPTTSSLPVTLKIDAGLWAYDLISDDEFIESTKILQEQNIIKISSAGLEDSDKHIPAWTKNIARWWAEGLISDAEFTNDFEYLIEKSIVSLGN